VRTSQPDLHSDDAEATARFKAVTAAQDLLKDPATRRWFDAGEIMQRGRSALPGRVVAIMRKALVSGLTLQMCAHPVFQRVGDDILILLPITIDEVVLGGVK
jgi:DnaJ-class molecular chaperone